MAKPAIMFLGVAAGVSAVGILLVVLAWFVVGRPEAPPAVEPNPVAPAVALASAPEPAAEPSIETVQETPAEPAAAIATGEAAPADAAEPFFVEFPNWADHYAYDPQRGRLAIVGPWEKSVGFLSRGELARGATEVATLVAVEGAPSAVAYKPTEQGGMFIVGQQEPPAIVLIDADSLSVTRTISLDQGPYGPASITTGIGAKDPFIYAGLGRRWPESTVRLDVVGREPPAPWDRRAIQMTSTPDGQVVYAMVDEDPAGLFAIRVERTAGESSGEPWNIIAQAPEARANDPIVVDPAGAWVALGRDVYFADLRRRFGELAFRPLVFLERSPWAVGATESELVIASINSSEIAERFPLVGRGDMELRHRSESIVAAFVDQASGRLIVASRESVASYPLPTRPLPEHPTLVLEAWPQDVATVGETYSCELTTSTANSVAELVDGPKGATIENNKLRWTPATTDIGAAEFCIRLSAGEADHEEAWSVGVYHQKLDVPFAVLGLDTDDKEGTRAVVWGVDFDDVPDERAIDPQTQRHLAIVDLATRQVIVQRTLPINVAQAELTTSGVYVRPDTSRLTSPSPVGAPAMQIVRLSADDLSTLEQAVIQPGNIFALADKFLYSLTSDDGKRYTLPDLQPAEAPSRQKKFHDREPINVRVADGWIMAGALWDEALEKPKLLLAPVGHEVRVDSDPFEKNACVQVMRGYLLYSMTKEDHRVLYGVLNWHFPLSPFIPAMLREDSGTGKTLELLDLNSKTVVRRLVISNYQQRRRRERQIRLGENQRGYYDLTGFATTPDKILYLQSGEVLTIPIASLGAPLPLPFHIEPEQSTFTLPAGAPEQVRYVAKGAKRFRLMAPQLGFDRGTELESTTGEFTLSVEEHIPQLVSANASEARNDGLLDQDVNNRITTHMRQAKLEYQRLFGSRPSGVPVSVEVTVQADGPDVETAGLRHYYVVIVPDSVYLEHVPPSPHDVPPGTAPVVAADPPRPAAGRARAARAQLQSPSAIAYSRKWRTEAAGAPAGSLDEARREVETLNRRFEAAVAATGSNGPREWTDVSGKKIQATLLEATDAHVVLSDARGTRLTIPLERLSAADRTWAQEHPVAAPAAGGDARIDACLRQLGAALAAHEARHGSMPPARLLDDRGQPLLSWRVLVLRELGYERLAAQFRYDEPWDSPHNRELIPLMPAAYDNGSVDARDGRTALVTVAGASSLMSISRAIVADDLSDPRSEVLAVVETTEKAHVAWTRPIDPGEANLAKMRELLAPHDGAAAALFADNTIGRAPLGTSIADWKRLMTINDGGKIRADIKRE